jgi:hypothetical protein
VTSDGPVEIPSRDTIHTPSDGNSVARGRLAQGAIIIYFLVFLAAGFAACTSCPGFYLVMAGCGILALINGTRFQRIFSSVLLIFAIVGFSIELRHELRLKQGLRERARQIKESNRKSGENP